MRTAFWFFMLFSLIAPQGCANRESSPARTASCPLRPTTEAKRFDIIGEPWIVVSVKYPLNSPVECVGDNRASLKRVVARMTEIIKERRLRPDEFYGVGADDCVCKGDYGYTAVLQRGKAVIYCLTPEESQAAKERRTAFANR